MDKTLTLHLKTEWYRMIESGEKKEEYRDDYWLKQMASSINPLVFKDYSCVVFYLGYPKKTDLEKKMTFKINKIEYRKGCAKWGAEPNKKYIVISLGEKVR